MNELEDIQYRGGDPAYMWFFENLAYKHLDDIPDEILHKVLKSYRLSGHCVQIVFSGTHCNPEDPEQLVNVINNLQIIGTSPFRIFRSWIYLEAARRLDSSLKSFVPDVLVREMATDARALDDNDLEFWARVKKTVGDLKPPSDERIR